MGSCERLHGLKLAHMQSWSQKLGHYALMGLLPLLTVGGVSLVIKQLRYDLHWVGKQNTRMTAEHKAWWGLERFLRDSESCSSYFRGKRLGETIVGEGRVFGPRVGQEWLKTGWLVKDIYVLKREDEVAWNVRRAPKSDTVYVKVSLVPKPEQVSAGVDYILNAPSVSRIFAVGVTLAEEKVFTSRNQSDALNLCRKTAFELGAELRHSGRGIASFGSEYQARCLMVSDHFPIWSCSK